ncbi:MAG: hypothetical protein FJ102_26165 [Deltaproteobacteria bacterium]|nr:hypothetical protein [Deltaproteobacteria bacterium]
MDPASRLPDYGGCTLALDGGYYHDDEFRSLLVQIAVFDEAERLASYFMEDHGDIYAETYTWADDRCWTAFNYVQYDGYEEYDEGRGYSGLDVLADCGEGGFTTEESWSYWTGEETTDAYTMVATNETAGDKVTRRTLEWQSAGSRLVERQVYDWVGDEMARYDQYLENNWSYHEESEYDPDGRRTWAHARVPGGQSFYFRWTYDEHDRVLTREFALDSNFDPVEMADTFTWDAERYVVTQWTTVYADGSVIDEQADCTSEWPWSCESTILDISADGTDTDESVRFDTWSCP